MTEFLALGDEPYVLLTTFRRSQIGVPTPVWVGRDGDALLVTTIHDSGKVKRIRNDPTVELTACDRTGVVPEGAVTVRGRAEILTDPGVRLRLEEIFAAKYAEAWARIKVAQSQRPPELRSVTLRIVPTVEAVPMSHDAVPDTQNDPF